jgi:hypothetical protein
MALSIYGDECDELISVAFNELDIVKFFLINLKLLLNRMEMENFQKKK